MRHELVLVEQLLECKTPDGNRDEGSGRAERTVSWV